VRESADVVVVGAGLFGTSIAFQLARRGVGSVVLVERGPVCGGDSGVSFSMVRRHYSNEPVARLAMRGVDVIQRWEEEVGTGDSGFVQTGYLLTATPTHADALRDNVARLQEWGLDTAVVETPEIPAIEPLLSLDGIAVGAYEPDGGFADTYRMTLSWFAAGIQAGVRPAVGRTVTGIRAEGGRVRGVDTDGGPIATDTVVLAVGSWGPELARTAGLELPIALRRLEVSFVRQPADRPQVRVIFSDMASNLVMRPDRAGLAWVVAYQPEVRYERRDDCPRDIGPEYEAAIRDGLRERIPAYADAEWAGGFAGAYDYTPDWNPLIGPAPGIEGLYLALGWSGHGFKLAPSVGEVVADEIAGRTPAIDVSALRPDRFERGEPLWLAYGPGARA
jgi:glycine/D-amino acid oxidase-like deaminating enzyme